MFWPFKRNKSKTVDEISVEKVSVKGAWLYDLTAESSRERNKTFFKDATRKQLVDRIVELEAQMAPFVTCLGGLDDNPRFSVSATSDLFPMTFEDTPDGHVLIFNTETRKFDSYKWHETISEEHERGYQSADSVSYNDGSKLPDSFDVISVHQSELCAYVSCGSITMGDIRRAIGVLYPTSKYGKPVEKNK